MVQGFILLSVPRYCEHEVGNNEYLVVDNY